MIKIVDEALKPFYLEHDYKGFRLYDEGDTNPKILESNAEATPLLQNIIKRKIALIDATCTLAEFDAKCKEVHEAIVKASGGQTGVPLATNS